ncbi:MAG: TlpA disulfide reductase family protein [Bacteroides sp.]
MRRKIGIWLLLLLFVGAAQAQEEKLPSLLKETKSGKVMFSSEKAKEEMKLQRLAQDRAVWAKWGGKPCPVFSLTDLNGRLWSNESVRGKVTLINFWQVTGGPCMREIPWLNKLCEKYPELNFLACTLNDAAQVKAALAKVPFLFCQLTDALPLWHAFGIVIVPTAILLNSKGNVQAVFTGTNDSLKREVEDRLKELEE